MLSLAWEEYGLMNYDLTISRIISLKHYQEDVDVVLGA